MEAAFSSRSRKLPACELGTRLISRLSFKHTSWQLVATRRQNNPNHPVFWFSGLVPTRQRLPTPQPPKNHCQRPPHFFELCLHALPIGLEPPTFRAPQREKHGAST